MATKSFLILLSVFISALESQGYYYIDDMFDAVEC